MNVHQSSLADAALQGSQQGTPGATEPQRSSCSATARSAAADFAEASSRTEKEDLRDQSVRSNHVLKLLLSTLRASLQGLQPTWPEETHSRTTPKHLRQQKSLAARRPADSESSWIQLSFIECCSSGRKLVQYTIVDHKVIEPTLSRLKPVLAVGDIPISDSVSMGLCWLVSCG